MVRSLCSVLPFEAGHPVSPLSINEGGDGIIHHRKPGTRQGPPPCPIGQTPVRESDKQRLAFQTDADPNNLRKGTGYPEITLQKERDHETYRLSVPFPAALAVAGLALFAFIVLASPGTSLAASHAPGMATAGKASKTERVEVRINELRSKLKITPEQEEPVG